MSGPLAVFLVVVGLAGGVVAAVLVSLTATTGRGRSGRWAALALAPLPVAVAAAGEAPVAAVVAAVGLVAAAVVDAVELRIPTRLALGTAVLSSSALFVDAASSGAWDVILQAALGTAIVVGLFAALWVAGGMGFGDVRLGAAAGPTAAAAGLAGAVALLWGAFVVAGVAAVAARVLTRSRRGAARSVAFGASSAGAVGRPALAVPFGPAIAAGWLLAQVVT